LKVTTDDHGVTRVFHLKIKTVIVYSLSCYSKPICIYLCLHFLWNKKKIVKEHTKASFPDYKGQNNSINQL